MDGAQGFDRDRATRVVVFSGGRGSDWLSSHLLKDPQVRLTLAINGYDDGRSTGEIRRFLGDSLGPSDFRKNAVRAARQLGSCDPLVLRVLEERLPSRRPDADAVATLRRRTAAAPVLRDDVEAFLAEWNGGARPFAFGDCSIGNIVFGGGYLQVGRRFNDAVDRFCCRLGLPAGMIDDVTSGETAYLAGVAADGTILASEADLVAGPPRTIRDIFLVERPLETADRERLGRMSAEAGIEHLAEQQVHPALNARLAARLSEADLIVYAPGTQHSSLYPSYLTEGLADVIAGNLTALKLLITNIRPDVDFVDASAVDVVHGALRYLMARACRSVVGPSLITHYVVNLPPQRHPAGSYVLPGRIDTLEDPRRVRLGRFEDGASGRHDAIRLLNPFVRSLRESPKRPTVGVVLEHATSPDVLAETLVEMARGAAGRPPIDATVFHAGPSLDPGFTGRLPFRTQAFDTQLDVLRALASLRPDYIVFVDSSGMYRGEDIVAVVDHLGRGRVDGVWGRRLSRRGLDVPTDWPNPPAPFRGVLSRVGNGLLGLVCLVRYGQYLSDTLSGVRAARASDVLSLPIPMTQPLANWYLLASLLGRKADLIEVPVRFLPLSSAGAARRTTVPDGVRALWTLVRGRMPGGRAGDPMMRPELPSRQGAAR